jgi:hypothetical protein
MHVKFISEQSEVIAIEVALHSWSKEAGFPVIIIIIFLRFKRKCCNFKLPIFVLQDFHGCPGCVCSHMFTDFLFEVLLLLLASCPRLALCPVEN